MKKMALSTSSHSILSINDIQKINSENNHVTLGITMISNDIGKKHTVSVSNDGDVFFKYQSKIDQSIKRNEILGAIEKSLSKKKWISKVAVTTLNITNEKLNEYYINKLISQLDNKDFVTMDTQRLIDSQSNNETLVSRIAKRLDIDAIKPCSVGVRFNSNDDMKDGGELDTLLRILFCVPKSTHSGAPYTLGNNAVQRSKISQPIPICVSGRPYIRPGGQKYIYIPFIDDERVIKRLIPLNITRVQQGKSMFLPVFKDQQQITHFRRILANIHLDPLLQYLSSSSQTDLSTLDSTNTLYISAHGAPGDNYAYDVTQKRISARALAFDINNMGLKPEVSVKMATCHSGEGDQQGIQIPANLNDEQAFDYVVNHMGAFEHSLAGAFEKELINLQPSRTAGIVYGTIGAHVLTPSVSAKTEKISSGKLRLNTGRAGAFFDVVGTRPQSYQFKVRKSDMKRGVGLEPSRQ
ncbi:hypothetical protein HQQ94_07665 [Shewanella sp. VB17]|uniref:hypothetical protein n=1 Tax=Shewanella sp. VB17 TaxID=2739432 RepID=UPI00156523E8|nr:hypothetical protein [Shewanella sp. VB17]NRD73118.1 hypothetical protein [Shewanella sp. VB17]